MAVILLENLWLDSDLLSDVNASLKNRIFGYKPWDFNLTIVFFRKRSAAKEKRQKRKRSKSRIDLS